jgi:hypothetical protein
MRPETANVKLVAKLPPPDRRQYNPAAETTGPQ